MELGLSSGQLVLLFAYIIGTIMSAAVAPLLTWWLTKPKLEQIHKAVVINGDKRPDPVTVVELVAKLTGDTKE